ncbi:hypothetical protein KIPB_002712 [Kipferlia bialata]|uniref:Guanine nucleotide-binding protein subunit beta-like protein n=1 Tax=Kipferlia bialata TaxID=797122 RepID=A0A9K3CSW1_9EUKA|nr:hypothetical protein KIPB_002712 [Kipferlia bialata]|eukprot:g2712.t1
MLSCSSEYVVVSFGQALVLINATSGETVQRYQCNNAKAHITGVSFLPSCVGEFVTCDTGGVLTRWSVASQWHSEVMGALRVPMQGVVAISVSATSEISALSPSAGPDTEGAVNNLLLRQKDGGMAVYCMQQRRVVYRVPPAHQETVFCVASCPADPNLFATGSYDGTARIWDVESMSLKAECGTVIQTRKTGSLEALGEVSTVFSVAFSQCGRYLATGDSTGKVSVYTTRGVALSSVQHHSGPVYSMRWVGGGKCAVVPRSSGPKSPASPRGGVAADTGVIVTASFDCTVGFLSFSPDPVPTLRSLGCIHTPKPCFGVAVSPLGLTAVSQQNGEVLVYKFDPVKALSIADSVHYPSPPGASGPSSFPTSPTSVISTHKSRVFCIEFSPHHGHILAVGSDDASISVHALSYDGKDSSRVCALNGHTKRVRPLLFHPALPHVLISGSWDGTVRVWDYASGTCLHTDSHSASHVYGLAVHPDKPFSVLVASRDLLLRVFDVRSATIGGISPYAACVSADTPSDVLSSVLMDAPDVRQMRASVAGRGFPGAAWEGVTGVGAGRLSRSIAAAPEPDQLAALLGYFHPSCTHAPTLVVESTAHVSLDQYRSYCAAIIAHGVRSMRAPSTCGAVVLDPEEERRQREGDRLRRQRSPARPKSPTTPLPPVKKTLPPINAGASGSLSLAPLSRSPGGPALNPMSPLSLDLSRPSSSTAKPIPTGTSTNVTDSAIDSEEIDSPSYVLQALESLVPDLPPRGPSRLVHLLNVCLSLCVASFDMHSLLELLSLAGQPTLALSLAPICVWPYAAPTPSVDVERYMGGPFTPLPSIVQAARLLAVGRVAESVKALSVTLSHRQCLVLAGGLTSPASDALLKGASPEEREALAVQYVTGAAREMCTDGQPIAAAALLAVYPPCRQDAVRVLLDCGHPTLAYVVATGLEDDLDAEVEGQLGVVVEAHLACAEYLYATGLKERAVEIAEGLSLSKPESDDIVGVGLYLRWLRLQTSRPLTPVPSSPGTPAASLPTPCAAMTPPLSLEEVGERDWVGLGRCVLQYIQADNLPAAVRTALTAAGQAVSVDRTHALTSYVAPLTDEPREPLSVCNLAPGALAVIRCLWGTDITTATCAEEPQLTLLSAYLGGIAAYELGSIGAAQVLFNRALSLAKRLPTPEAGTPASYVSKTDITVRLAGCGMRQGSVEAESDLRMMASGKAHSAMVSLMLKHGAPPSTRERGMPMANPFARGVSTYEDVLSMETSVFDGSMHTYKCGCPSVDYK